MPAEPAAPDATAPPRPERGAVRGRRALLLLADTAEPCGVADFAGRLAASMEATRPGMTTALTLGRTGGAEAARRAWQADALVLNIPVLVWRRRVVAPPAALALGRARAKCTLVILHEWGSLHPLRRLALVPALALAERILLLSPHILGELESDPLVGGLARRAELIPLAPNVERPAATRRTPLAHRLAAARAEGRLVLGAFGSIYPGKRPMRLLDIAAVLKRRGHRPLVLQAGGFVDGRASVEAEYRERVRMLGLQDEVIVTGFIAAPAELYGLLDEVDAFAYDLAEGLTARRSSVLASLQTGRPVITTAPASTAEFAHHPRYRALIESGAIGLVPAGADAEAFADAIVGALRRPAPQAIDVALWWQDTAEAVWARLER